MYLLACAAFFLTQADAVRRSAMIVCAAPPAGAAAGPGVRGGVRAAHLPALLEDGPLLQRPPAHAAQGGENTANLGVWMVVLALHLVPGYISQIGRWTMHGVRCGV
jgi:hypothetical protein